MGEVFRLKRGDTRPILEVVLHDPPPKGSAPGTKGPVHDSTGATVYKLHIWLSDGTKLTRNLAQQGVPTESRYRYSWIPTDWDPVSGGGAVGGLVVGPQLPLQPGVKEHRMEYEIIGPGVERMTFPNDGFPNDYDILRITSDIGQG